MKDEEYESTGDYYRALREGARIARYDRKRCRLDKAEKIFKANNVDYVLCNDVSGHFNLLKDKKVVMSYWDFRGKCYIPSRKFSKDIGIKNCIKMYKELFKDSIDEK